MSIDEFLEEIKHRTGHVYMYIATGINVHSLLLFFCEASGILFIFHNLLLSIRVDLMS